MRRLCAASHFCALRCSALLLYLTPGFPLDAPVVAPHLLLTCSMRPSARVLPLLLLLVCISLPSFRAAQPEPAPSAPTDSPAGKETLEERLQGVWVLAEASTPGNPSGIGIRQKIFTPGRWEMIQRDPKTGEVVFHHGGTYRLNGDILEQKVEFASNMTKSYIGSVRKFKIKVEKDTYTQIGLGNPFNEVWKRFDGA